MTESDIKRIVYDIDEVPVLVKSQIRNFWPDTIRLYIDSDGNNFISTAINGLYRIDSNVHRFNNINVLIDDLIRTPLMRDKKLREIGI